MQQIMLILAIIYFQQFNIDREMERHTLHVVLHKIFNIKVVSPIVMNLLCILQPTE